VRKLISLTVFFIIVFSLVRAINPKNYSFTPLEVDRNVTRQEYFGEGLGKIYKNRFGVIYFSNIYPRQMKLQTIFFSSYDNPVVYMALYASILLLGIKRFR